MNRRELLRSGGVALAVASTSAIAGCSGDTGPGTTSETATQTPTRSPTPTASETPSPTPCPNAGETPTTLTSTAASTASESLDARIRSTGHYAWFALTADQWGRQGRPYDIQRDCSRWLAAPTSNGGVRCFVKDIDTGGNFPRSVGFDLHLGELGRVEEIRIPHEIVQSGPFDSKLAVALYLDEDENGEFFQWEDGGDSEPDRWVGVGDDEEAIDAFDADGEVVIGGDTSLRLINSGTSANATLDDLKSGDIYYYGEEDASDRRQDRNIDASTEVAVYVGLADTGNGEAVEAIIRDVDVVRTDS